MNLGTGLAVFPHALVDVANDLKPETAEAIKRIYVAQSGIMTITLHNEGRDEELIIEEISAVMRKRYGGHKNIWVGLTQCRGQAWHHWMKALGVEETVR
jgi:hypothetical protein